MRVAFCIPTTSHGKDWTKMSQSYLQKLKSINTKHKITFILGYDEDDTLYNKWINRLSFNAKWIKCNESKGHVTAIWNMLYKKAVSMKKFDYYWLAGDDLDYCNEDWLDALILSLKSTNNIGIAGVYNGNPALPMTQFLVSKKHLDFFGFAYPEELKNWYCDNWIQAIYPSKYIHYHPEFECINAGGKPRYKPEIDDGEWKELIGKYQECLKGL